MIERSDFDELLERKAKEQQERLTTRTQAVYARQAKVEADRLTGDPTWDKFLTHIQPLLEDALKVMDDLKLNIMRHDISNEGVMAMRILHAEAKGRAAAYSEVIGMPKTLAAEWEQQKAADALAQNNGHA